MDQENRIMEPSTQPTENQNKESYIKKYSSTAWEFLKVVIIALIIVLPIRYFIFQPFIVKGESMVPNFQQGDYLIVDEVSYKIHQPERGDVVVLKYPLDTRQRFIKRIIGLPGETIDIQAGIIRIAKDGNNIILDEKKYLPNITTTGSIHVVLGENTYYVLGDNRQFSSDSRIWGVLPKEDIVGKVFVSLYPVNSISYIKSPTY